MRTRHSQGTAFQIERLQEQGVRLIVDLRLSLEQFRKLLAIGFGYEPPDVDVVQFFEMANARILPPDAGSFSGIGSDVNELLKQALDQAVIAKRECD